MGTLAMLALMVATALMTVFFQPALNMGKYQLRFDTGGIWCAYKYAPPDLGWGWTANFREIDVQRLAEYFQAPTAMDLPGIGSYLVILPWWVFILPWGLVTGLVWLLTERRQGSGFPVELNAGPE